MGAVVAVERDMDLKRVAPRFSRRDPRSIGSSNVGDARSPSIVRNRALMDGTAPSSSISEPPGISMNLLTGG